MQNRADELNTRSLRALIVLEEVVSHTSPVTAFTIGKKVDLPKQTLHRILMTLTKAGFLQKEIDSISYTPGRRLKRFSVDILSAASGREVRMAILNKLARDLGETCNLVVPSDDGMVYFERVETHWPLRIELPIGSTVPFHCTASGKLYLSSLSPSKLKRLVKSLYLQQNTDNTLADPQALLEDVRRIRDQGHSEDNQEFIHGMLAVAVPVLDRQGNMLASLAVHGPSARLTMEVARGHIERLRQAANDLAGAIFDESDDL